VEKRGITPFFGAFIAHRNKGGIAVSEKKSDLGTDMIVGALSYGVSADEPQSSDIEGRGKGRPEKYDSSYRDLAAAFFSEVRWVEEYKCWQFPSRVFFARSIGVALNTVKNWEKEHEDFGRVMAEGIEHSKELRVMFAENEKVNPAFSKFVLGSAYGMTEKSAVEVGGMEGKPFEVNINVVKK
jgi:hypothetical protein